MFAGSFLAVWDLKVVSAVRFKHFVRGRLKIKCGVSIDVLQTLQLSLRLYVINVVLRFFSLGTPVRHQITVFSKMREEQHLASTFGSLSGRFLLFLGVP